MRVSFNQFSYTGVREQGLALPDDTIIRAVHDGSAEVIASDAEGTTVAYAYRTDVAAIDVFILAIGKRAPDESSIDIWFAIVAPAYLETLAAAQTPLAILEAFALRFGIPFVIEGQSRFFATNLSVEFSPNGDPTLPLPTTDATVSFLILTIVNAAARTAYFLLCLDLERYANWRAQAIPFAIGDTRIRIHAALQGHATPFSFCDTRGIVLLAARGTPSDITAFEVTAGTYALKGEVSGGRVTLLRNGQLAQATLAAATDASDEILIGWQWSLEMLRVFSASKKSSAEAQPSPTTLTTLPASPPPSLITWARSFMQQQRRLYEGPFEIYTAITALLASVEETIRYTGMQDAFWDIQRSGRQNTGRRPKREPTVHRVVEALLRDAATLKNISVIGEPRVESGNVDFLIHGTVVSGVQVPVCAEFKNAHATDLLHGLSTQLPDYMRSKGADFGVFVVLYYRCSDFDEPRKTIQELTIELEGTRIRTGLNINVVIWDLAPPLTPSVR